MSHTARETAETIFAWIKDVLVLSDGQRQERPLFIGFSAPQGAGKTTISRVICETLASSAKLRGIALSIDDFYLTHSEQVELSRRYPLHSHLQRRGYPGTHDLRLGERILEELSEINLKLEPVRIPVYDKSAHSGCGDRLPENEWRKVTSPLDFVILEGWMLGFTPVRDASLLSRDMQVIDSLLAPYDLWHRRLDAFVWLQPEDFRSVLRWRVEAEERMKAEGKMGMSHAEVESYIRGFLPAYETYLPGLAARIPVNGPFLRLDIDPQRRCSRN